MRANEFIIEATAAQHAKAQAKGIPMLADVMQSYLARNLENIVSRAEVANKEPDQTAIAKLVKKTLFKAFRVKSDNKVFGDKVSELITAVSNNPEIIKDKKIKDHFIEIGKLAFSIEGDEKIDPDAENRSSNTDPDQQPTPGEPVATRENTPTGPSEAIQNPKDADVWYVVAGQQWSKWLDNGDGTYECINMLTDEENILKIDNINNHPNANRKAIIIKPIAGDGDFYQWIEKRKKNA